jgi:tRNA G10  N-methylase Trm11
VETISSISYNQEEIIENILKLHVPQGFIDCDCTYSKGNFYKNGKIKEPVHKFDKFPQTEDTIQSCATNLLLEDNSINCMMFDPPFLATTGKSLTIENESNKINKRFGVFSNEKELHKFYVESLKEFNRVIKDNGVLIFKCQDKVSSGKQYMSHVFIINQAEKAGFYTKDLFILIAKNRIIADWQTKNQQHARKFHSYFLVFEKKKNKINYGEGM